MKLKVTQENLNRALSAVSKIANTRTTLPILANVLIKTDNNRLSLSTTNLDLAITNYIGVKVSKSGSITVPARLMQDFVSSLPGGVIELNLQDTKLHIKTDQYQSVVNGIAADDFPAMPSINNGKTWSIKSNTLKKALQQVVFAASNDETRPVLTGVLIHTVNSKAYIAATDSYRLTEKEIDTTPVKEEVNLLVPATAMQELLRVMGDEDNTLNISYNSQQAMFQIGDIELLTRLIDGKYPAYQKLIPTSFSTQATLKRTDLLNVTKVSSLFARESAGSITIDVDETKKQLSIRSVASQLGENTAHATAVVKGSGSITLNSRYLLDALSVMTGEEVTFGFNGKLEPTMLSDTKEPNYKHIIMPLKS